MEDKDFLKQLGEQVAKHRKKAGITQKELALRCEMEKPSITRIEKGRTNPTSLTLLKISEALGTSISDFFLFNNKS